MAERVSVGFNLSEDGSYKDGEWKIYPNSMLFRVGDYPTHQFTMSKEEAVVSAAGLSQVVGGDIEHTDFLQGRACKLRRAWIDPADSEQIRGEVAVPLGLDQLLSDDEKKLSLVFHRKTKAIEGITLTMCPVVKDAALMSENARLAAERHRTWSGEGVIQGIHDRAAEAGAICDPKNSRGRSMMHSKRESAAIQEMHDTAVKHGASCNIRGKNSYYSRGGSMFKLNLEKLKAYFTSGATEVELDPSNPDDPIVTKLPDPKPAPALSDAEFGARVQAEVDKRLAAFNATQATFATQRITEDATNFANELIRDERIMPHEGPNVVAAFTQAALDDLRDQQDNKAPSVKFSAYKDGKLESVTGTRLGLLKIREKSRPQHGMTEEHILQNPAMFGVLGHTPPKENSDEQDLKHVDAYLQRNGLVKK